MVISTLTWPEAGPTRLIKVEAQSAFALATRKLPSARMIEAILTGIVHADRLMEVEFCEVSGGLSPQISPAYKSFSA